MYHSLLGHHLFFVKRGQVRRHPPHPFPPSRPSMTYPPCCIRLSTPPSPPERPPPPSNPLPCPPHAPTQCSRHRNFVNTFLHYEDAGTLCVAVSPGRT